MTASIQRYLSTGVLAIWGLVMGYFFFADELGNHLAPAFIPWAILSGIVLLLMAAGLLFLPGENSESCGHDEHDSHVRFHAYEGDSRGHEHHGACDHEHHDAKSCEHD